MRVTVKAVTDRTRIRIAGAATALFLAAVSAAGLAARDERPGTAAAPAAQTPAATAAPAATLDQRAFGDDEGAEAREDDE